VGDWLAEQRGSLALANEGACVRPKRERRENEEKKKGPNKQGGDFGHARFLSIAFVDDRIPSQNSAITAKHHYVQHEMQNHQGGCSTSEPA
jgi:hypothetical protein